MSDAEPWTGDSADRYYRNSGAVPLRGILLLLLGGGAVSFVLSMIYGAVLVWNPFIYINLLGTLFIGACLGGTLQRFAGMGRVRNPLYLKLVAVVMGIVTVYFSWVGYLLFLYHRYGGEWILIFDPRTIAIQLEFLAANPVWHMGGGSLPDWGFWFLWTIEAGTIFYMLYSAAEEIETPYCEACERWAEPVEPQMDLSFAPTDVDALRTELEAGNYTVLAENIRGAEYDPADCQTVLLYDCPGCEDAAYLSVLHRRITVNDEGKAEVKLEPLIRRIAVPHDVLTDLRDYDPRPDELKGEKPQRDEPPKEVSPDDVQF